MGGLDFASQLRDVGGFVFKRFSPKQRHQIDKIKQYQVYPRPDQIETSAFKLQLARNTLERMHWATKVTFSKPSLQFLPRFEVNLQITPDKRLPTFAYQVSRRKFQSPWLFTSKD